MQEAHTRSSSASCECIAEPKSCFSCSSSGKKKRIKSVGFTEDSDPWRCVLEENDNNVRITHLELHTFISILCSKSGKSTYSSTSSLQITTRHRFYQWVVWELQGKFNGWTAVAGFYSSLYFCCICKISRIFEAPSWNFFTDRMSKSPSVLLLLFIFKTVSSNSRVPPPHEK